MSKYIPPQKRNQLNKKVRFNLNKNQLKYVERLTKEEICGTIGIDNWVYFSIREKYEEWKKEKKSLEVVVKKEPITWKVTLDNNKLDNM